MYDNLQWIIYAPPQKEGRYYAFLSVHLSYPSVCLCNYQ